MNLNVYGDISPRTAGYAKAMLLERGQHLMVVERFGLVDPLQQNKTKTAKWRRYNSLARASAPLAEGIPMTGQKMTYTDVQCTLEQLGDAVSLTDVIKDTHEDPVLQEYMTILGEQAAETIEEYRINFMKAGTNVFYASGVASRALVNAAPNRGDFRKIYRFFASHKAQRIGRIIAASNRVSTEPVDDAYFVLGHTSLDADIRGISGFIPSEQYSSSEKRIPGEIGKVEQFRIVLTAMFEPWLAAGVSGTTFLSSGVTPSVAAAADVFPLLFIAKNAYSIVPLQGKSAVTPMVLNPGTPSAYDPAGQIGWVAWKSYQGGCILNQSWIARLECAATGNPT